MFNVGSLCCVCQGEEGAAYLEVFTTLLFFTSSYLSLALSTTFLPILSTVWPMLESLSRMVSSWASGKSDTPRKRYATCRQGKNKYKTKRPARRVKVVRLTCGCDKSQHQHRNCEVQSHLDSEYLRRENRNMFYLQEATG